MSNSTATTNIETSTNAATTITTLSPATSSGSIAGSTSTQLSPKVTSVNSVVLATTSAGTTSTPSSGNSSSDIDFKSTGFIIAYIVAGAIFVIFVLFVLYRSRSKSKESLRDLQAASGTAPPPPTNKVPVLTDLPFLTETIPDRHPMPSSNVYAQENAPGWSGPKVKTPQQQYAQYPVPPSAQLQNRSSPEPNYARPLPNPPVDPQNSVYQQHPDGYDLNYYENAGYYDQSYADPNGQYHDQSQMQYYDQSQYQQYPPHGNHQQYYNYDQKQ
ncbi:hypothetical protein HK103_005928 [Boothiomyces macroporosus]|uniref:Uncharacterized protein n=1 Tax=Boothiomyces macroporosus TaxID=261099 RepID=A0AAD5UNF0_9FUNG|nr:hypothetical protein HK103_005928 [Boothiomyces macroporosus]